MNEEGYRISYERELWGWTPHVWDTQALHSVLFTVWPSFTRDRARRRVARAIARYERGETYVEICA